MPANNVTVTATYKAVLNLGGGGGGGGGSGGASISPTKADYSKNSGQGITVTLSRAGYTLRELKNDSYILVQGTDYTVSGNSITVLESYLATLAPGTRYISFAMSGGGTPRLTINVKAASDQPVVPAEPAGGQQGEPALIQQQPQPGQQQAFSDVQSSEWYYHDVMYVFNNSLMLGTASGSFAPEAALTRGMMVTILYRQAGSPGTSGTADPFGDVQSGAYYGTAVSWAAEKGIVSGYGNGMFGPDDNITREQLAVIMYNYQQFSGLIPAENLPARDFVDGHLISDWAQTAVYCLTRQGVISGKPGDLFDPGGNATRAEFASILHRFLTAQ
jgi:hypothetical protein